MTQKLDSGGWSEFFKRFREDVYPVFAEHGILYEDAVMLYQLNAFENRMARAMAELKPKPEPKEPWEKGYEG